ncbi:hypothetical protein M5K25_026432 [Dendrobium thyrsiflorum]|uniref:Uncharacterized protein n=1 Tax=Dendrobium thyrsiflorum TaxID=117978 RepID=A0ABD0TXQ1_DENTH
MGSPWFCPRTSQRWKEKPSPAESPEICGLRKFAPRPPPDFDFLYGGSFNALSSERMVGEWMMDPIKIPWFRHPGSSWSLVYLVRGGSRPNLTEGSLSAAMGCVVQGYLIDLGWLFAIVIWTCATLYLRTCRRLLSARTSVADPVARRCNVVVCLLHTALRRRPRVGAASECVRPSRLPIEAVTVQSRVRRFRLEEEDEVEGEEEEEEREEK